MSEGTIRQCDARPVDAAPDWLDRLAPDRARPLPLGRQLYLALYAAITSGEAPAGTALPASRRLAARFGLARNTVVAAYAQLADEGLVTSAGRRGTIVEHVVDARIGAGPDAPRAVPWSVSRRSTALAADAARHPHRPLAPGEPDPALFPAVHWQRAMARAARLPSEQLGYRSDVPTRLQAGIARHLALYRSLVVDPARIVVTSGTRQSLLLAATLFADTGSTAWMESPGYPGAVDAFGAQGLAMRPCPVDAEGAVPLDEGVPPRLVYLTPCFQYPLGVPLSATRRDAFLALSARHGSVLFEDDYDSEFRDDAQPRPALAASAERTGARVLHAGTFSKLVFPAARVAWLVLPEAHAERARSVLRTLGGGHGTLAQASVAELLDGGVIARHLQRARAVYARRRSVLTERVSASPVLALAGGGGLCAVLALAHEVPLAALERKLDEAGLGAVPLERFDWAGAPAGAGSSRARPTRCGRLVVGLGNVDSLTLPATLARLERVVRDAARRSSRSVA